MASIRFFALILGFFLAISLIPPSQSETCSSQKFTNNKLYQHCSDLSLLSSYLHWTYDSSSSLLSIAFLAPPAKTDGWIAWAINPNGTGMVGAQALIAFKDDKGAMTVNTYSLNGYKSIVPGNLSFEVPEKSAEYSDGMMKIFATVTLPTKLGTTVNQVWQVGSSVSGGFPAIHDMQQANFNSKGSLNLVQGQSNVSTGGGSGMKKKNIHGILNAVSWGILFPFGVILARYLRTFPSADPAWFYLHVSCQISGYAIGVAGWGTGLKLGSESQGIQFTGHRNIGIALFCLATVQMFALFLRPKKEHKYRFYWNIYHHSIGYAIVILGIINVFKGLSILHPATKWKSTYIVVISALGVIALLLEAITWVIVLRRKSAKSTKPYDVYNNGQRTQ